MNVLYLTINPNRVSTTVPTEGWFRCLMPSGLRPVLVCTERGAFPQWCQSVGIPSYIASLPQPSKLHGLRFVRALRQLRAIVREHSIQLIHCNEQNCYPIGSYLARLSGLPVVASVHFTMQRDFCNWAFRRRPPERLYFVSEGNRRACESAVQGIIPFDAASVLNNGLDLEKFRPDRALRDGERGRLGLSGSIVIGVACALRARKQLEHLFEAASRMPSNVRVLVAGGPIAAEADYAASLLNKGRQMLGDRLICLGHLEELRPFYNALDLFVNTSQEEACSISVLEAMACGTPVVGYASKSVDTQILPDGGRITPQDDIGRLTDALLEMIEDPSSLAEGRAAARRQVETAFDIRGISDRLFDDYRRIVDRGSHYKRESLSQIAIGQLRRPRP